MYAPTHLKVPTPSKHCCILLDLYHARFNYSLQGAMGYQWWVAQKKYSYDAVEFDVWGVEQDFLPYVQQLVLSNVPIEEVIINPYVVHLMVLQTLCDCLPTIVKLSTLDW